MDIMDDIPTENVRMAMAVVVAGPALVVFPFFQKCFVKGFNHKNHKLQLSTNSDPVSNTGDSHAPVPFFVTTNG